jgi:hypothetical protein
MLHFLKRLHDVRIILVISNGWSPLDIGWLEYLRFQLFTLLMYIYLFVWLYYLFNELCGHQTLNHQVFELFRLFVLVSFA